MKTTKAMLPAIIVSAAVAVTAVSAMAQDQAKQTARPDASSGGECLRIMNVWDYTPVPGNKALIVTDRSRHKYKMTFYAPCTGLQYHMALKFRSRGTGGLSCLTRGDSVITHDIAGPPECLVSSVTPYTPQMEKADAAARAQDKAKKTDK